MCAMFAGDVTPITSICLTGSVVMFAECLTPNSWYKTLRLIDEGSTFLWHHTLNLQFILRAALLLAFLGETHPTRPLIGYIALLEAFLMGLVMLVGWKYNWGKWPRYIQEWWFKDPPSHGRFHPSKNWTGQSQPCISYWVGFMRWLIEGAKGSSSDLCTQQLTRIVVAYRQTRSAAEMWIFNNLIIT